MINRVIVVSYILLYLVILTPTFFALAN